MLLERPPVDLAPVHRVRLLDVHCGGGSVDRQHAERVLVDHRLVGARPLRDRAVLQPLLAAARAGRDVHRRLRVEPPRPPAWRRGPRPDRVLVRRRELLVLVDVAGSIHLVIYYG
jgi:hypothetical protein